jgi:aerobic carbon-monoxide dehydrogenase medium subunit
MIPSAFTYHAPTSLEEAISLLDHYGDEAKLLAGGHSLLPAMKLRLAAPAVLIDLGKIAALRCISTEGAIRIGAMATWAAIVQHAGLRAALPALPETVGLIGDIQVRNRGTLGGALAHADPAADAPALMLALDARLHAEGPAGARVIAATEFFIDMLTTALAPGEILTAIELEPLGPGAGAAYLKLAHPASRYAIVGVAAYVRLEGELVRACRVAVTGAGPRPERQPAVEQALLGGPADASAITQAADQAGDAMVLEGDMHASAAYRLAMLKVYARRALTEAVRRAQ